ncbi:outer membrane beta-barrel protein [Aestuariivirga litoralis]|uniref:outer membrane beta-barrel protein n=1 Tax=Aestuariivirga litoralis TaxID=2650924 RepID=UPI0018C6FCC7|nr:outer membrane beta-barrel protein [Aestuariivirga litoralis]MBG1233134.1 outer membrane beta-barrel protein [Aestuariivirga litoralis]
MVPSRVIAASLFVLLASSASFAADMDIYGNVPAAGADIADDGSAADGTAVVAPQMPVLPDEPEKPHRHKSKTQDNPYDVYGFDDGAFALKPTLQIGSVITNNAGLTHDNRQSDVGIEIKPSLSFTTKWPVHQWSGNLNLDWQRFSSVTSANRLTGSGDTTFKLDIRRDTYAEFGADFDMSEANAGSSGVPSTAKGPRRDFSYGANTAIAHDFGSWAGKATLGINRSTFGNVDLTDGTTQNNSDSDYVAPSLSLRATFGQPGARIKPYAQVTTDMRLHDHEVDSGGFHRNSQGYGAALGVVLDDGPIWSGDIAAVLLGRHYSDSSLANALVPGVTASLTWSPTELWTIVANAGVTINDSSAAGISSSAGWTGGLNATYALRDNINLRAGASFSVSSDDSGVGHDLNSVVSLGADWQLNPHLVLSGTLQSTWNMTPTETANYDEQRAFVGVTIRP